MIDERPDTISQTVAFQRALEAAFGVEQVEPAIFFIGLQPHTHLERYALDHGVLKPGYNPMSMMPWVARKLLWNPEPMGSAFGRICLEAFGRNPHDFGRTVMDLLEARYRQHPLKEKRFQHPWPVSAPWPMPHAEDRARQPPALMENCLY